MKITIKNIEVELKLKMRALVIYEQISDKAFNPKNITDMMVYMYSLILANAKDIQLTFEEFMDWLDDNPEAFEEFNKFLISDALKKDLYTKKK